MTDHQFALFDTAIGCCGIVWSERGIAGVQIPEASARGTRGRILRRFPAAREAAAPQPVRTVIGDIVALLRGERKDLSGVAIDMTSVPDFNRRVYDIARGIGPGQDALLW